MKTGTLLKRWTVAFLAIVLSICLFAFPAFAEDTTESTTDSEEVTTDAESTTTTGTETGTKTGTGTETDTDEESGSTTGNTTTTSKKMDVPTIVGLIILGVIVVVGAVLCIRFREKVGKFLRVYKSECNKIVWLPWDQTKKSSFVVIVVLIVCALAICLLDFALSKGILAFINLF